MDQQQSEPNSIIITSVQLNNREQFAFMQRTLLVQIFKEVSKHNGTTAANGAEQDLNCPTCVAFSDRCCQTEPSTGQELFKEFVKINLDCYWDASLAEALNALRYQGYVCPGILVMIASDTSLETMADAWRRRLIQAPPMSRICQLGLSNGCVVKPVLQKHAISLEDALCQLLARMKQLEVTANMESICEFLLEAQKESQESRSNGQRSSSNKNTNMEHLKDSVHSALGSLIKQRRVYYTGKGYFLVAASSMSSNNNNNSATSENNLWGGLGPRLSQLRHSLRSDNSGPSSLPPSVNGVNGTNSPVVSVNGASPNSLPHSVNRTSSVQVQTGLSPQNSPSHSNNSSVNSSLSGERGLERSQSLRISKKSIRSAGGKGGSLRLSKRDAVIFREEDEDNENNSDNLDASTNGVSLNCVRVKQHSPNSPTAKCSGISSSKNSNNGFERKNSFLGNLFGKKNRKSPNNKPEIVTFSAQFPPPELVEQQKQEKQAQNPLPKPQSSPIYSQVRKPVKNTNLNAVQTDSTQIPHSNNNGFISTMSQRSGPNANFVIYERPTNQTQNQYPVDVSIYSSPYGISNGHYAPPIPPRPQYPDVTQVRPKPPQLPPLPYRPPPPNPYNNRSPGVIPRSPFNNTNGNHSPTPFTSLNQSPARQQQRLPPQIRNQRIMLSDSSDNNSGSSGPSSIDSQFRLNNNHSGNSGSTSSSSSSPSSIQQPVRGLTVQPVSSQQQNEANLYNENLMVIERSNQELEFRLNGRNGASSPSTLPFVPSSNSSNGYHHNPQQQQKPVLVLPLTKNRIDTIHNHRNLSHEIIYEVDSEVSSVCSQNTVKPVKMPSPPQQNQPTETKTENGNIYTKARNSVVRSNSNVYLRNKNNNSNKNSDEKRKSEILKPNTEETDNTISSAPSFPSLSDLTISEMSNTNFKSLTAQKLMAGLSFNSIDTLIEVNAVAELRQSALDEDLEESGPRNENLHNNNLSKTLHQEKHNESSETIDFGVI